VQRREHDAGSFPREEGQESGVGVEQHDPMARLGEGIGDSPTRTQRDIALMRDAAGQDDHVQTTGIAHDPGFLQTVIRVVT